MFYWITLFLAIIMEVCGTCCMKISCGFSRFWPSVFIFFFYALSFVGLTMALKRLDVSVVYAVWAGIGTALVSAIGVFFFQESVSILKIASIFLIIIGVVGLHLTG
jgi:small multidrug resistance pump